MRLLSAKSVFNYKQKDSSVGSGPGITNVESRGDGEASRQGIFYHISNDIYWVIEFLEVVYKLSDIFA